MHERGPVSEAAAAFALVAPPDVGEVILAVAPDVDHASARDVWFHVVAGTPAEKADLAIRVREPEMACFTCGTRFTGEKLDPCPSCGGDALPTVKVPTAEVIGWTSAGKR